MNDELRTCETCGATFKVSARELEEEKILSRGRHFPIDCPEDLDTMCPACEPGITECKGCRPKQDGMRA